MTGLNVIVNRRAPHISHLYTLHDLFHALSGLI